MSGNHIVYSQCRLTLPTLFGIETIKRPVTGFHRTALLYNRMPEARTNPVYDTRTVGYHNRRTRVALGLDKCVYSLLIIGSKSNRGHIDVAVGHHHPSKFFLCNTFAVGRIFCHGTAWCCL